MKRTIFTLFAAFALVLAMPAVAQQEDTRTNPSADSTAGHSGLTLTGTVAEWNDEQLTLKTATGIEHIQLTPRTDRPVEFEVGENVSVDYTRTGQGVMIAQKIRPEGEMAGSDVETTQTATTDLTAETEADAEPQADVETEGEMETDVETTTADAGYDQETDTFDTESDSDLPATGSELPLVALLGFLSVAAAFGVRSFLR